MKEFLARHAGQVLGVLSGFDRIRFRGTFRQLAHVTGMTSILSYLRVLLKDFGDFSEQTTERDYNWRTELPGIGFSSPVVWDGRLYLTSTVEQQATFLVLCVNKADGAAWLFRRMCGREVFDANLKTVPTYWLYMRLPNGEMLRDGDGVPGGAYWNYARTALLCYAYNGDPVLKGEFVRQGGLRGADPVLFLLLDNPAIKAQPSLDSLPRTLDFGPVLGGMVARTGWNMGMDSADVVAEVKGGGYHFGNHQHADAGAFQIYYRGLQVAPLAQYRFYGTPYDMNFAKRSIAQSMMLVLDPQETFIKGLANDGGSRFLQTYPRAPKQAKADPTFHYCKVVSCGFGPSNRTPRFSYFCALLLPPPGPAR